MKMKSKRSNGFVTALFCAVLLFACCGCETLPDGRTVIPEGTVIYSPGDPDAYFR
jgi:hypothetical protein